MTDIHATLLLLCQLEVIRVTITTPSALTNRHCAGWCLDTDASLVDDTNGDVTLAVWDAVINVTSNNHNITIVSVPDWTPGTFDAGVIVWYFGQYWCTSALTTDTPGAGGPNTWSVIDLNATEWSVVIADPTTYGAYLFQEGVGICDTVDCKTLQLQLDKPGPLSGDPHVVYFVYQDDSIYMTSGEYTSGNVANIDNCTMYAVYSFSVIDYAAGSYVVGDFIYYGGNYYACTRDSVGQPDSDPGGWTLLSFSDGDFQLFWSTISAPEYSGNANVSVQQMESACTPSRITYKPTVEYDCNTMQVTCKTVVALDADAYAFMIDEFSNVTIPSTYDTDLGAFTFDIECGISYEVHSFALPAWSAFATLPYFEGELVIYDHKVYRATVDIWSVITPGFTGQWQLICTNTYVPGNYADFAPILSDCYMGHAAFYVLKKIFCACPPRYEISMNTIIDCNLSQVTFDMSSSLGGLEPTCVHYAVFVFNGEGLVASFETDGTYVLTLPNDEYTVQVCAVPCWISDEYVTGAIVWHNGKFWIANADNMTEPGSPEWDELQQSYGDYVSTWSTCETSQAPTNRAEFSFTVACERRKTPLLDISADYNYVCGNSTINGVFNVNAQDYSCYCVAVMLYSEGEFVGSTWIIGSPTAISWVVSALAIGVYQLETYVIPCYTADEIYNTGEIVCYNGVLYISAIDLNSFVPGDPFEPWAWTVVDEASFRETVSTIKDPLYIGNANYAFDSFFVDCEYDPFLDYSITAKPNCEDFSVNLAFDSNIINTQFTFVSWVFDVTDIGKPVENIVISDLNTLPGSPIVGCYYGISGSVVLPGLENDHSYCVLTLAVPYYKPGHMYNPGDLTYYSGSFYQLDPAMPATMDPPGWASPDTWILMGTESECSSDYWTYWFSLIGDTSEYAYNFALVSFNCKPREDASELDMSHASVNSADASFALIRTNPALTGNVTLTVDTAGDLWLNSISSNREISKDQYKHFALDSTRSHPANMYAFLDHGKTPSDIFFDIHADVNPAVMTSKYEDQFDFSYYYSGVKYMDSKYYDEKFTYFAPLYLKKIIPEYFVVFKINDPLNAPIDELKDYDYANQTDYVYELLKRASIIKSFDITDRTKLGRYLRSIINDPQFPKSPLEVNFAKDGMTTWNGASVASGTWNSKGELLDELYKDDDALKHFEEYVTTGYRRHGIIFPNIVNIEFLFDDETSEVFDFNRYIGFYVNAVTLEKFDIDVNRYNSQQDTLGNSPIFFDMVDDCSERGRIVSNQDGVKLPYDQKFDSIDYRDFGLFREKLFVNFVKDKYNMLHSMAADNPYSIALSEGSPSTYVLDTLRLADKSLDLSCMYGTSGVFLQDRGFSASADGLATTYIKIKGKLGNYDTIRIYHDAGSNSDIDGRFDSIIVYSQASSPEYLPNPGDYYAYNFTGSPATPNAYYVNGEMLHGRVDPIVSAINACLQQIPNKTFEAIAINDTIFIRSYASSLTNGEYAVRFNSYSANEYGSIEIGGYTGSALNGKLVNFTGGTDMPNRLVIDLRHKQKILDNMPELRVRTVNGWSRIVAVANYMDGLDPENLNTQANMDKAYADYFNKIVLTLEKNEKPDISDGTFIIRTAAHPEFGMLSFFNVKDFDGDFYSGKYNRYPYWEYYKHLVVHKEINVLLAGVTYIVRTDNVPGSIIYNGVRIDLPLSGSPVTYETSFVAVPGVLSYSVPDDGGNPTVSYGYPYEYHLVNTAINPVLCQSSASPIRYGSIFFDQNKDMSSFDGFFGIRDSNNRSKSLASTSFDLPEYNRRFTSDIIRTEYDFYRENFTKDFAFKSKVVPYICKWGYLEGMDARDNEYRLNNHMFFGEHNFSPSHIRDTQDESHMTHEWYYLVAGYPFIKDRKTASSNYCYFDEDVNLPAMLSVEGEFERYFTYVPLFEVNGVWMEVGKMQPRYSTIRHNDATGQCETFFRGAKLAFRDVLRDSDGKIIYDPISNKPAYVNSRRFDGHKFSVLLRPVKEDLNDPDQPPVRMRFIEHSEYKYVLLLIELAVGYTENVNSSIVSPITRTYSGPGPHTDIDWLYGFNPPNSRADGDYRLSFEGDVSDITYSFLYGVKNKKFGWRVDLFSTIRLATLFSAADFTIDRAYNEARSAYSNYDINLLAELSEYGGNNSDTPYVIAAEYFGDTVFNGYPVYVTQNYMRTSVGTDFSYSITGGTFSPDMDDLSAYKQIAGGRKYYEKFMKKLSFASIANYINTMGPYKDGLNGFIEYETYDSASSVPVLRNFYAQVITPSEITKEKAIVYTKESNIPDKFRQVREIGFEFNKGSLQNGVMLYRYGGGYEPIFRNVFTFVSKYAFDYNPSLMTIFLANNVFATESYGFGVLDNFCHMKVSTKKILALQDDAKFYPAYELLNEITIGRDKFFALHSSWDYGFHKKYNAKDSFENVAGSLRVAEDYTYFSKVLNLPFDTVLLDYAPPVIPIEYDSKITYAPTRVDDLASVDIEKYCVVYAPGKYENEWVGYINMRNAMIHKFKMNGVSAKFDEFLTPNNLAEIRNYIGYTNVDDYVTAYLTENVYNLYDAVDSLFYMRNDNDDVNLFSIEYHDYSVLANQDWSIVKDVEINKYSKHVLSFRFVKSLNSGAVLSPAIKIRLI